MSGEAQAGVDAALRDAAQEYQAESAREGAATRKAVAQLNEAAQSAATAGDISNEQLAGFVVSTAVLFLPALDKRLVYSDAEQERIAAAMVPVLKKYFPDGGLPPELLFLGTVAIVTAPKLLSAGGGAKDGGSESAAAERAPGAVVA